MTKYGQFVVGPAGSGKSTYCRAIAEHCRISRTDRRNIKLINLDPGAETYAPDPSLNPNETKSAMSQQMGLDTVIYDVDVRDLITVRDVMEEFMDGGETSQGNSESTSENVSLRGDLETIGEEESKPDDLLATVRDQLKEINSITAPCGSTKPEQSIIGPNGALVYCMEYLAKDEFSWLRQSLDEALIDGDYVLFDCPGQIELYTHVPAVKRLVNFLVDRMDFRLCGLFMVDAAHFLVDVDKYFSVTLTALSVMINLEGLPFVNIFSKMDIVSRSLDTSTTANETERHESDLGACFTSPHELVQQLTEPSLELYEQITSSESSRPKSGLSLGHKYERLTRTLATVIDSYDLIRFHALNLNKKHSIEAVLYYVDTALQYDEDREPRDRAYTGAEDEMGGDWPEDNETTYYNNGQDKGRPTSPDLMYEMDD